MEKIRKGNDIEVQWAIYAGYGINEAPYDLTGRNLTLYLRNQFGRHEVYEYTVDKHVIRFMYWGKDQKQTGTYSIELVENEGREGMHTVDECDAFTLVNHSCQTGGDSEGRVECIHLQFRANMGISIPANGGGETPSIEVDDELSAISTNPVQNKVVTKAINGLKSSLESLYGAVEELEGKVAGYDGVIAEAISKSDKAAEDVMAMASQIESMSQEVKALSGEYESAIEDKTLVTPNAVGGIAKGTKVSDLEGKTFAEMFDELLFPTVNPTFTAPSASIAWKNFAATQEVGSAGPASANFTTGYNAGAINLNGVKQANRGGAHIEADSFIYVNGDAADKTLPATLALGTTKFKYRAAFAEGPQPKNNKGGDYGSPLAAGTVDSAEISVNGTFPWYASTATAGSLTKQALVAWNTTAGAMSSGEFTVQPHTAAAPQMFKLPRKAASLQMYNTVAKAFETVALSDWTETSAEETINGVSQTYYTYSYKGDARGSVKLIVKF